MLSRWNRRLLVYGVVVLLVLPMGAFAAGKKRPQVDPNQPSYSTPVPARTVLLGNVGTTPFHMPNGHAQPESINADLRQLLVDATGDTHVLRIADAAAGNPCHRHLELRAGVSIFQLEIGKFGITIGYAHETDSNSYELANVEGFANVTGGNIVMDFGIWECVGANCTQIVNSEASHITASVDLGVELDFTQIKTGPQLMAATPIANAIRTIMHQGLQRLVAKSDFHRVDWKALVAQDYDPSMPNLIYFQAGQNQNIGLNQLFEIYSVTSAESACNVFKVMARGHTIQANGDSSVLQIDRAYFDPAGIKRGDIVKVLPVGPATGGPVCQ